MKIYIYGLQDPVTQQIRYVGKTKNPKMRFHNHMNPRHNEHTHKRNWINSLKELHLRPCMLILDEVSEDDWKFWEKYWIQQCIVWGFNLVNHTSGGEGSISGNSTSFKKGQISWNKGTSPTYICEYCGKTFKASKSSKRKFCSKRCYGKSDINNATKFKKGQISHRKGMKGKTKPDKNVYQYNIYTGAFIKKWITAKEASQQLHCNEDGIGNCCRNTSKTCGGFMWKYYYSEYIEIKENVKLKIKLQ